MWVDGEVYRGQWLEDKKHGEGDGVVMFWLTRVVRSGVVYVH